MKLKISFGIIKSINSIILFIVFFTPVFSELNECKKRFNECHDLLTKTSIELDKTDKDLKKTQEILVGIRRDLSKTDWFPLNWSLGGFVGFPDLYGLYVSWQILSFRPVMIPVVKHLGIHTNAGLNSITGSLSYSLDELAMYNSKIHFLVGIYFDIFNYPFKNSRLIGIGFSLNF